MFACWRRVDAADPETFLTGVAAVLSDYPEEVITRVTDPRTGLPGRQAFPPSAFEVKQACEAEMAPIRRERERERRYLEGRNLLPPPDRGARPTIADLKAKLGPTWGIVTHGGLGKPVEELTGDAAKAAAEIKLAELAAELSDAPPMTMGEGLARRISEMRDEMRMAGEDPGVRSALQAGRADRGRAPE